MKASELSLKLSLPEKQIVAMCDGGEHAAGYVLLIEDYTDEETRETRKFAPIVFDSKGVTKRQMSLAMSAKELIAMHLAFDEFGHFFLGNQETSQSHDW